MCLVQIEKENKMNKMNKKYRLFTLTLSIAALMIFSSSVFAQENVTGRESPTRQSLGKTTVKLMPCPAPSSSTDHAINTKGAGANDRIVPGGQSSPMNPIFAPGSNN